jgi:hypothetical protein
VPIEYRIDHGRRLVVARGLDTLTGEDVFGYQREVWSKPEVAGYDELVDMTAVREIALASPHRMRDLAALSAAMDHFPNGGKFAIVAPQDLAFGLGRMYEAYRSLDSRSTKQVQVFRNWPDALAFLGVVGGLRPGDDAN